MDFPFFNRDFDTFYFISQIFALAALLLSLYAFQRRKKVQILNYTVVSAICSVLHYVFLGAWTGVATKSVGVVRNAICAREAYLHKTSKIIPFIIILCYIIIGVITYISPLSLLPISAAIIYTVAIYFGSASRIRYIAVLTSGLWFTYDICVFSIVGILSESIFITGDLIAILRYHQKPAQKLTKKSTTSKARPRKHTKNSSKRTPKHTKKPN